MSRNSILAAALAGLAAVLIAAARPETVQADTFATDSNHRDCYGNLAAFLAERAAHPKQKPDSWTYCCDNARSPIRPCAPGGQKSTSAPPNCCTATPPATVNSSPQSSPAPGDVFGAGANRPTAARTCFDERDRQMAVGVPKGIFLCCEDEHAPKVTWCGPNNDQGCCKRAGWAYDIGADIPDADPSLRYELGFRSAVAGCLESACTDPGTIFMVAASIALSEFKMAEVAAGISAGGATLSLEEAMEQARKGRPRGSPYDAGRFDGATFCRFMSAVLAATAKAPGSKPQAPGASGSPGKGGLAACYVSRQPVTRPQSVSLRDLSWLKQINQAAGSNTNCANVALAVDRALAGGGVSPAPPGPCMATATLESFFKRSYGPYTTPGAVNNEIYFAGRAAGAARGIVTASRGPGTFTHTFNIAYDAGDVVLLDGQLGRQISWRELADAKFVEFKLLRTD